VTVVEMWGIGKIWKEEDLMCENVVSWGTRRLAGTKKRKSEVPGLCLRGGTGSRKAGVRSLKVKEVLR